MKSGIKIAVVGGGSSYTPELISGLVGVNDLAIERVTLVDVPEGTKKMESVRSFCQRLIDHSAREFHLEATLDLRQALSGADFVLSQFRVGGMEARARDERIPLQYGAIGQETVGAGGFANALRTIPVALDIARELERVSPRARLINFTNPSGIITEALLRYSSVDAIGLCNVPITIERTIAQALHVPWDTVRLDIFGLNHLSFVRHVYVHGQDIMPEVLEYLKGEYGKEQSFMANIPEENWQPYMLEAFPMIPNPYLQYYWNPDIMRKKQVTEWEQGRGTRATQVMKLEQDLFKLYDDPSQHQVPDLLMRRGGAYYSTVAVMLIESLALNQTREMVVNVRNGWALAELPPNSVVEVPAVIDGRGARPLTLGALPQEVKGLIQQVKAYEELTIEAAIEGDRNKALAALVTNPLVPSGDVAYRILNDILQENREYLGRFAL